VSPDAQAGWYQDASNPGLERWWDGRGWTDITRAAQGGPAPGAPLAAQPDRSSAPISAPWAVEQVRENGFQPPWVGSGAPAHRARLGARRSLSAFHYRNRASVTAIGMALVYMAIVFVVHIAILGIFPVIAAVGAMRRREPLAPLAIVISVIPLVLVFVRVRF
jgi:hypothetical protein